MCGIFGYFDSNKHTLSSEQLEGMGRAIYYRGPDGHGCYHDEEMAVALGNQRLAILDIEHGQQPFYSEDRKVIVVQNGEIFNHVELAEQLNKDGFHCVSHCDTEVILRIYQRDGIKGLSLLNGMFAIAIYDVNEQALYLVRDRVGEKPLYFSSEDGRFLFSSEIKSILGVSDNKSVCVEAMNQFFAFNYVPPPLTMFSGIKHVMPGHYLRISQGVVEDYCWWGLSSIKTQDKSEDEWITLFNNVLDDAVRIRLRSDVAFGAFLSGGVDSSSVVGFMSKHLDDSVNTFCIGFDDPKYDESIYAQEASERFSTHHTMKKVRSNLIDLWPMATYHCDQPHGDVSFLPTYKVAELAADKVKMVLTGDGADELFAGYDKYKLFFMGDVNLLSNADFQKCYLDNISLFNTVDRNELFSTRIKSELGDIDVFDVVAPLYKRSEHMDRINQALYIDMMLLLPGNNLVKPDRMGMAVSLENRAPFLDYRMIELAFSMPGNMKLNNDETKYIYKKAVAPLIGENLAYRKKQMFTVPVGEWFKDELFDLCSDLLLSRKTQSRDLFDYSYVKALFESHCKGSENYTREIRALMAMEIWLRIFMDEDGTEVFHGA